MEKNENGYPRQGRAADADNRNMGKAPSSSDSDLTSPKGTTDSNRRISGGDCGESMNCLDSMPLAYVYAPMQRFCMLYSAEDALDHGTLFEALYKPKEVYGRE
jgi:hypothetical protein